MAMDRRRKRKKNSLKSAVKRIVGVLITAVLILMAMHAYNYATTSDRFAIDTIDVNGLSRVSADEMLELLDDLKGQNLLLAPLDSYRERMAMHPRVERVAMKRVLPRRIVCSIEEREPVALVFTDHFVEVDRTGMVMAEDDFSSLLDLPIITGVARDAVRVGKVISDDRVPLCLGALQLCKELGGDFAADISELRLTGAGLSIRTLRDDRVLMLGNTDYELRLKKYFLLRDNLDNRDQTAQLIDLRFKDQVVLRGQI